MARYKKPKPPLPEPLSGSESGTFAHTTITERFPKIARQTLEDNYLPPRVRENLEGLIHEIPLAGLRPLEDASAPDFRDWQDYLEAYMGKNWLQVPWFLAEMYFYRRIIEAIGFYRPGSLPGYDPFLKQKLRVLESTSSSLHVLGDHLQRLRQPRNGIERKHTDNLKELLVLNVWGNQADLSMWSASEDRPDHQTPADQDAHLLVKDSDAVFKFLDGYKSKSSRVDIILDNFGPELVNDIALADFLLSTDLSSSVHFHAKPCPHYVSDAMIKDVYYTIDYLASHPSVSIRRLAQDTMEHIKQGRLEIMEDYFWTSPLPFWEMPNHIHREMTESDLVISKGDANYRRLAGDLKWPATTPFADAVRYFPSPLLALRVLKAELALGLTPGQVQELNEQEPGWKVSGNWAVIQFFA
jgi:uncharacterized protein with ATP-grasp and redox domains